MAIHSSERARASGVLAAWVLGFLLALAIAPLSGATPPLRSPDAPASVAPYPAAPLPVTPRPSGGTFRFLPTSSPSATGSGSNTYFVGAQVPASSCSSGCTYLTNSGVRSTIQVVSQPVTGCLSYWVSDDSAANLWGQVGYYICNSSTPVAFYQIWNLSTGAGLTSGTTTVSLGNHTFSMSSQSGGSVWAYALDGVVFGTYDMGAGLSLGSYPVEAVTEEGYVSSPWNPAQVWFASAIQTLQTADTYPVGNGWYSQSPAFEPWMGCTSGGVPSNTAGYSCWGIAGNLQDPSILGGAMATGGGTAPVQGGTYLWNSVTADFALTASPTEVSTLAGASGTSTISVNSLGGFAGTVSLAAAVSPAAGLACTLSPTSVSGGSGSSTLSCSGPAGNDTVTVTGTSGSLTHSASVRFTVSDFTLATGPTSLAIDVGSAGTSTISIGSVNGFAGTVGLSAAASPAQGLACSVDPTAVIGSGTATLSCTGSAAGTYTVTVTGTSGSVSHSASVAVTVNASGVTLTVSFTIVGDGTGYASPALTYVQGGAPKTATLTTSATSYTVDANSRWSVTNPLSGSSAGERWQTAQATSGTATASVAIVFGYDHQYAATFAYSVLGGGSGYTAPTVTYTSFGTSASVGLGVAVWADAGTGYSYPAALAGSGASEAWRSAAPAGTVTLSATLTVAYYHQFSVTFGYTVLGGGSGYAAPSVASTCFGAAVSVGPGATSWIDAGAAYAFTNPLSGSGTSERWTSPSASGTVSAAGSIAASYDHQFLVTFAYQVLGGGTGSSAPAVSYTALGAPASAGTGLPVWADAGTAYAFANPLGGSTSTAAWRSAAGGGSVTAAGTLSAAFYYQFLVLFSVQTVNGSPPPVMPNLTATVFGGPTSLAAGGSSWVDANGAYSYPGSFAGASGERWMSASPASGTVLASGTIAAAYYHQYNATFAYAVSGGGSGYGAPSVAYTALGTGRAATAGASVWADAEAAYAYSGSLPGGSSTERWITSAPGGTVTGSGSFRVTYTHQYWLAFTYTVKGGGSGYSAPNVTYANLTAAWSILATGSWVWADAGSAYQYQNPLPGSTSSNSWQTNNGAGKADSSTAYSATYRHQFKVKIKTTTTAGALLPEVPLVNVTVFGSVVSLPAGNVSWVDAGGTYSLPGVLYGPLPGERWMTGMPPSGLVLEPMNITAAYVHQYYLAIQVNTASGGDIVGSAGWHNATDALTLEAVATPGWRFQGWIGSGLGSYSGNASSAPVMLNAPVTETAAFYVGLTLTASGGGSLQYGYGGTTGWVPAGRTETLYLAPGTEVTVHATPALFYQLEGWGGSGAGNASTVVFAANAPAAISAAFGLRLYQKPDSLLGLALVFTATLVLALAVRRHARTKRERRLRAARRRAGGPIETRR